MSSEDNETLFPHPRRLRCSDAEFEQAPMYSRCSVVSETREWIPSIGEEPDAEFEQTPMDVEKQANWLRTMWKKLENAHPQRSPKRAATIFRVPNNISESKDMSSSSSDYEAMVVSIGPLSWSAPLKEYKWQCVRYLLSRHGTQQRAGGLFDKCLLEILALAQRALNCYSTISSTDIETPEFTEMLMLDGCFIIYLLLSQEHGHMAYHSKDTHEVKIQAGKEDDEEDEVVLLDIEKKDDEEDEVVLLDIEKEDDEEDEVVLLDIEKERKAVERGPATGVLWIWNLVLYDLLKLENQIPFFVLQTMFDMLKTPKDADLDLVKLALKLFKDIRPFKAESFVSIPSSEVLHLLHLFYSSLLPSVKKEIPVDKAIESPQWIPSATDLQAAGVKFKKKKTTKEQSFLDVIFKKKKTTKEQSFLDVTFKKGVMEIPPLHIYDYTDMLFRNLIAFEQCYAKTDTVITIYAAFMDCLINTAEDVSLLNSEGILVNRLGDDEEVAQLFNKLCDQVHYASDKNYLWELFTDVTKYSEAKWPRWRAGLVRDYFSNPWSIISVVVAAIVVVLTFLQTFFAMYSYFLPPA